MEIIAILFIFLISFHFETPQKKNNFSILVMTKKKKKKKKTGLTCLSNHKFHIKYLVDFDNYYLKSHINNYLFLIL